MFAGHEPGDNVLTGWIIQRRALKNRDRSYMALSVNSTSKDPSLRCHDIAYRCFLFIGVVFTTLSFFVWIPIDADLAEGLAMCLALPLLVSLLVTVLVGVAYSIRVRREWQLSLLSLLTVAAPLIGWAGQTLPPYSSFLAGGYFVLYGLLALVLPSLWFRVRRKKLVDHAGARAD